MATMAATPRKAIALLTTAAGLGALLVAGVVLYRPLEERYWLWKASLTLEEVRLMGPISPRTGGLREEPRRCISVPVFSVDDSCSAGVSCRGLF